MIPRVLGRSSRGSARSFAIRRPPRYKDNVERARAIDSVTFPLFVTPSSNTRMCPVRATRSPRSSTRRTTVPGARTTTTTPIRTRTARPSVARRRVVKRTRASWSPGSARTGTLDAIVTRLSSLASARLRGRKPSQLAAVRRTSCWPTIFGRPRRSSANPARRTSSTTGFVPEFVTRTVARAAPASSRCAGEAVSATGDRAPLAPAEADASASRTGITAMRATPTIIAR